MGERNQTFTLTPCGVTNRGLCGPQNIDIHIQATVEHSSNCLVCKYCTIYNLDRIARSVDLSWHSSVTRIFISESESESESRISNRPCRPKLVIHIYTKATIDVQDITPQ